MNWKQGMDLEAAGDEELAEALKRGERQAFDELVRRHQGRVYAVAYRITCNRDDALDVAQEALLKAYRKIESWQPVSGFLPWLLRLTTNQAIDMVRWRKRRHTEPLETIDAAGNERTVEYAAPGGTGRDVRAQEIAARVQRALVVLSPAQRAVFAMRHYEGLQLADIAKVMGCSVGSVKVHLFRALRKLQQELRDLKEAEPESGENK
ncbi:MAG: sigma-70 family RNA polymerase sigma factor [Candidatus Hydrogenedentes bacterium]|nr:sigma-70 family RNA polymerase sigma factor [Candidatus Hydrogenedentota bacterium]